MAFYHLSLELYNDYSVFLFFWLNGFVSSMLNYRFYGSSYNLRCLKKSFDVHGTHSGENLINASSRQINQSIISYSDLMIGVCAVRVRAQNSNLLHVSPSPI